MRAQYMNTPVQKISPKGYKFLFGSQVGIFKIVVVYSTLFLSVFRAVECRSMLAFQ